MKIFQVVPYYPPHVGGMEYYVEHLSEKLAARGHEVTVFTSSQTNNQLTSTRNGVKIYNLKIIHKVYNVPIVPSVFSTLIKQEKPDLIHTHQYPIFFSDIAATASWLKNIPLMIHVHVVSDAKSAISGFISNIYYTTIGLKTLRTANSIIVPSLMYKNKISQMHIDPSKIKIIHYGIDTKKFIANNDGQQFRKKYDCQNAKVILSVGRLNYQKGFHFLILAMPKVLRQFSSAKLVIVGEGEQFHCLLQLTKSLGIAKSVIFTGAIAQVEMPLVYSAADLFVLPSLFESFGISLIEAQSAGKPVIGTRSGGAPEAMLDGKTGLLVEPGNIDQLADAIIALLADERLALSMGRNGQVFVNTYFSMDNTTSAMISAYEKLLS